MKCLQPKLPVRCKTSAWVTKGDRSHHGGGSMPSMEKSPQAMSQSADLCEMGRVCQHWEKAKGEARSEVSVAFIGGTYPAFHSRMGLINCIS